MATYSLIPGASKEYQEMLKKIMEENRDKPVEEVAKMLAHIDSTTARLGHESAAILRKAKSE